MVARVEKGLVLRATAGFFDVELGGEVVQCRLRGRLKKEKQRTDICVIGDDVDVLLDGEQATVEFVHPRRTRFSRRHPGRGGQYKEDVLVANLDQVVTVFAFRNPPFQARMLDRFLVIAEHNEVDAVIIANKVDQVDPAQRATFELYQGLGYPVFFVSAVTGEGLDALRTRLLGRISALTGPSGAGKSSLANKLQAGLELAVGELSEAHGKGRHTTRVATLHPLTGGGYLADTPGIRELGTWDLPAEDLDDCFPEFRPFLGRCRFRGCRHDHEPDCAVQAAIAEGDIGDERYDSYLRLLLGEGE